MPQGNAAENRHRVTASKFYLPAGVNPPFDVSRFERVWERLFNHRLDPTEIDSNV